MSNRAGFWSLIAFQGVLQARSDIYLRFEGLVPE